MLCENINRNRLMFPVNTQTVEGFSGFPLSLALAEAERQRQQNSTRA